MAKFKKNLVDQICQASGGPVQVHGQGHENGSRGYGNYERGFHALVEDLVGALDKFKVGEKEKNDLLGALGPMKSDIVEK